MVALQILVLSVQVRILVSQRQSSNSMYYTDLGDFSYKTGSETGHLVIAGMSNSFSLYNALMELCKEKKWLFSNRPQAWNIYRPNSPKALNGTHRKDRAEVKYKSFRGIQRIYREQKPNLGSIRITKEEIGREAAAVYPDWLDGEYEFEYKFDVQGLLEYYTGIITPTALGKLSGINPKQMWNYMHGVAKPRKAQIEKIETALHKLGHELINTSF